MNLRLSFSLLVLPLAALAQTPFAPFDAWKTAVGAGDVAALSRLYSMGAQGADEIAYWSQLKRGGMTVFTPRILEMNKLASGDTRLVLRISTTVNGAQQMASAQQVWEKQGNDWKIVAAKRSKFDGEEARRLPQPAVPNVDLYADPKEAEAELKTGLAKAAKEHKRVIVVFGGNWCYDCHVLDTTFHSKDFAPLVDSNFVVVHINIGDDGHENAALAARFGVGLDKGVPSLGVLEADGTVVYAQKNGEFESTVKIGPDDVRAFLNRWKRTV